MIRTDRALQNKIQYPRSNFFFVGNFELNKVRKVASERLKVYEEVQFISTIKISSTLPKIVLLYMNMCQKCTKHTDAGNARTVAIALIFRVCQAKECAWGIPLGRRPESHGFAFRLKL